MKVEGNVLVLRYWIREIRYFEGNETRPAQAFIVTEKGTYFMEGEKAETLRDHPLREGLRVFD